MPDDAPKGGGGKKILGIPQGYLLVGGVALGGGLLYMWWKRRHSGAASSSTTVITGSVSSNTGIDGQMLNAILKDWQQHPGSTSTSTGSGGGPEDGDGPAGGGKGGGTGGGTTKKKTTKTTTKTTPPVAIGSRNPRAKGVKPPTKKITPITGYKEITVRAGQTLDEIARQYGITPAELAHSNTYVKGEVAGDKKVGQTLGTGAGLKTGQTLRVPVYDNS